MPRIIDYTYLFQSMLGTKNANPLGSFQLSQINSSSVQARLKAAGINTNSNQNKAVMKEMMKSGNGSMFTNVQAIKNLMKGYDQDGDYICPITGLAGLLLTEENLAEKHRITAIPESSREEMFQLTKREFLRENGVCNGDTTRRSDVYTSLYRKMPKKDRLAAGNTMQQYESAYRQAFLQAVQKADPGWELGMPIKYGVLDGITRESVEAELRQSGSMLTGSAVDRKA